MNPKIVLLGLDFLLFDCGGVPFSKLCPPFSAEENEVFDTNDNPIHVPQVSKDTLQWGLSNEVVFGAFCSTKHPEIARYLVTNLGLDSYFQYKFLNTSTPEELARSVKRDLGVEFDQILYIDNTDMDLEWAEALGIIAFQIPGSLTRTDLINALERFLENCP